MGDFLSVQDVSNNVTHDVNEKEWRSRLFFACGSMDVFERMSQLEETNKKQNLIYSNSDISGISNIATIVSNSNDLLTFWTVWEVSRYCMLSRLRTPFGGPKQVSGIFFFFLIKCININIYIYLLSVFI